MHSTVTNRISGRFWRALTLSLALVGVCVPGPAQQTSVGKSSTGQSTTGLLSLPASAQGPISAALGKDDSSYWVRPSAAGFRGENPRHALAMEFTKQETELRSHNLRWSLETRAYGYGNALHPVKAVAPQVKANRVEYRRDGVTEWYENGPLGLEQGFRLARRPEKANSQPLTVELALRGDLVAALDPGGKALELRGKDGKAALRYTGLSARDATGQELKSWLEVRGDQLLLRVKDGGARYPLVIDPWVQQAELTASDGAANDYFGRSVAVSGSTAVVGASYHKVGSNQLQGAAYVFVQNGTTWSQQAELTSSDGAANDEFGASVAVDGTTVVVGALYHQTVNSSLVSVSSGAAYVFVQSGDTWNQQAELAPSDGANGDFFGASVAVSGSTAVVGAPSHEVGSNLYQGAAYVFVQSGETWSQQAELTSSDGAYSDRFGSSVAVSGSTAVAGAPDHTVGSNGEQGAAYVFVESSGIWSQQAELLASDGATSNEFGFSVAVSGSTAVVGAPEHTVGSNTWQGAAYVFLQSGTTWSQQAELTSSDGAAGDNFGSSVAVSGSTAVVGALDHEVGSNAGQGAAYVYTSGSSQTTVTLSPASLNFASEAVDTTSKAKTVTLKNTGTATLSVSIAFALGTNFAFSSNTCGGTLDAGKTCKVGVTFTPTQLNLLTDTLTFTDNTANSPQTVALKGTGVAQATLTPSSYTFKTTTVGDTSAAHNFTLKNEMPTAMTGISYSTASPFAVSVSATTCGTTLNSKASCTIGVTFSPTSKEKYTGTLTVNDDANNSPQTVSLSGTGD